MKKRIGQVFSLVFVVVLVIAMVVPARANVGDAAGYVVGEFWDMMAGRDYDTFGAYWKNFIGYLVGEECPSSPDKYHHGNVPVGGIGVFGSGGTDDNGKFVWHTCDYCSEQFKVYASDLQQSYEAQVEELPAQSVTAAGSLIWYSSTTKGRAAYTRNSGYDFDSLPCEVVYGGGNYGTLSLFDSGVIWSITDTILSRGMSFSITFPMSGSYRRLGRTRFTANCLLSDGNRFECTDFYTQGDFSHYNEGDSTTVELGPYDPYSDYGSVQIPKTKVSFGRLAFYFPVYEIIPDSAIDINSGDTYNINSRPTSITGDYGIIGDNGQIIKVEGDKIVNETNNTYYNPATGETTTITDWSYNYEDRSYTVTTESGDTVTITYGDENVTIKEGDTIYNIYYLVNGSGSENPGPGPGPEVCDHTWTETGRTEPTCTTAGKVTSTCSKCSQTKTETIPATGHSWVVDRTVQTTYDEEGNLLQQGYTIYSCSVCGEQYKDMEGTGPPGPEEEKSIWEKIGDFFGTIGGGFIDIINAVFGKLLDALIALAEMLTDKLKAVVEAVLSIFEEIPAMFGGFLAFLTAMFPFLPPEIMTLLTFGIAAVVFIGIIKAIRR